MSRWVNGQKLPQDGTFLTFISCLNECIEERLQSSPDPDAPGKVTASEVAEGLVLLNAARAARDALLQPAQHAHEQIERELAEVSDGLQQMRALRDRLTGRLEEARSFAAGLEQQNEEAQAAASALRSDFAQAESRVRHLEERLAGVEIALEHWQDRYDRLYAECEMAREAAQEERLAVQDELSDFRAALWIKHQELQAAEAAWTEVSEDADRLREELRAAQRRESRDDEDLLRRLDEAAQQLMSLRYRDRDELLRTISASWERKDIYLLALRLGGKPGAGPKRARELMWKVGVRYYDPSAGRPGVFWEFVAAVGYLRLEPRPRLPRTRNPPSTLPDDSYGDMHMLPH
jgi:hypothetical protein